MSMTFSSLTMINLTGTQNLEKHSSHQFQIKDLGNLTCFYGIEIAESNVGVSFTQRKYALDILEETSMLDC